MQCSRSATCHEVSHLFAKRVLVGVLDDVDLDTGLLLKSRQHGLDGLVARTQQENDIHGGTGIKGQPPL